MVKKIVFYVVGILLPAIISCADHQVPGQVSPIIEIEDKWDAYDDNNQLFRVEFIQLGNRPIHSYGLVVVAGPGGQHVVPTVNDTQLIFTTPPVLGTSELIYPNSSYMMLWPGSHPDETLYFRAFVQLESGAVIYGSTVFPYTELP